MKVKVVYDLNTKLVKGYYPDSISYINIPTPFIEITEVEWQSNVSKNMIVDNNIFQEYQPTTSELFNKKKQELITYTEEQKDLKKINYIVKKGGSEIPMQYSIDAIVSILNQMKDENIYPTFIYYDKQFINKVSFNNQNELLFILNKFVAARRDNYYNNIPNNMQLINACTTIEEINKLQLTFIDLIITL